MTAGCGSGIAGGATIHGLIATRAAAAPDAIALDDGVRTLTYAQLLAAVEDVAAALASRGVDRGDRVAILSENSLPYALCELACARLGAIAACQNWRLAKAELQHCIDLVQPTLILHSQRYAENARALAAECPVIDIAGIEEEGGDAPWPPKPRAEAQDGWLIIYTSGTTGLPKAALISQSAEIARMAMLRLDLGLGPDDGFISWAPMFHMGGTEHMVATLMNGGRCFIVDGFDANRIVEILRGHRIGWLLLVPATITPIVAALRERSEAPVGLRAVGCMADLVPLEELQAITNATGAPYLNSFGSTETGLGPLSGSLLPPGMDEYDLAKKPSALSELRLVGTDRNEVLRGEVGEAWVRAPTLFSGYWNAPEANASAFHEGWYRMGDLFRQREDGAYDYVGRSKYLIKSGGENIYPAEIEQVLLRDPRIADAAVVRRADDRWGEVPVAVVVAHDDTMDAASVLALLEGQIASYKRPRAVYFAREEDLGRNVSGKVDRSALEDWVAEQPD